MYRGELGTVGPLHCQRIICVITRNVTYNSDYYKVQQRLMTKLYNLWSTMVLYLFTVQLNLILQFHSVPYFIPSHRKTQESGKWDLTVILCQLLVFIFEPIVHFTLILRIRPINILTIMKYQTSRCFKVLQARQYAHDGFLTYIRVVKLVLFFVIEARLFKTEY